jgi:DNA (cytosine-5)-methyltransferase 1
VARTRAPRAIDLFSGCGGLTLGLKQAGFLVIGAVELDPIAVHTYRANHKRVRVWSQDIRSLDPRVVMRALKLRRGQLDLLAACPPCQGFSTMRTLNGRREIQDPLNDLVMEFLRFVKATFPKSIMLENVPGLATDKRFLSVINHLRRWGYKCKFAVLNAAHYGVPQRRRRLILVGSRFSKVQFGEKEPNGTVVRDVLKGLPRAGKSGDPLHDIGEHRSADIAARIKQIPKDGGSRQDLGQQLPCHKNCDGFKDVYGRMRWNDVAPTITTGCVNPSKGRFLHPRCNRTITLREAALLQSFPADYYISLERGKFYAATMIGNALPPEFIRRHATALLPTVSQTQR